MFFLNLTYVTALFTKYDYTTSQRFLFAILKQGQCSNQYCVCFSNIRLTRYVPLKKLNKPICMVE